MDEPYLLRKCAMYYAHNSRGYVLNLLMAEIYTKEYAINHAKNHDDVDAVPISDVLSLDEINQYIERIDAMKQFLERHQSIL